MVQFHTIISRMLNFVRLAFVVLSNICMRPLQACRINAWQKARSAACVTSQQDVHPTEASAVDHAAARASDPCRLGNRTDLSQDAWSTSRIRRPPIRAV